MEKFKHEIFSKLKNIFSIFDLPLIESEQISGSDCYTTAFSFVPYAPIDLVSLMKAQCYFKLKVQNQLLNRLWFKKINIPRISVLCSNGKFEEFYKSIENIEFAQEFYDMISNQETSEHLRDYTEAELTQLVQQFPERARAFIKDDYRQTFLELSEKELGYDLDDYLRDDNVSPDTPIRDRVWKEFVNNCNWQTYLDELDYGQSEEWAREVASKVQPEDTSYIDTYNELYRETPELADRELQINLNRRFPNKSEAFKSKYWELAQEWAEDAYDRADRYACIFDGCISVGKDEIYAKTFAEGIISDYYNDVDEYWDIIATIYSKAKKEGLSDSEIYKKTSLFDSILDELESMELDRRIASANLALIEIESGHDKKEVIKKIRDSYLGSLTDDDFIELPSHLGYGKKNRDRNFNHDMLQTMFPNDDVDSEDFEDGLDIEDFY